jgi:KUP system potassium uptake protein
MATIRIADPIRPTRADNSSSSTTAAGGVYPIRTNSLDRRSIKSNDRRGVKLNDTENLEDENGLRQQGDFKKRQV